MAAKTIQVSDNDANYYTLPGNTGEFSDNLGTLDDTIFGQTYQSQQPNTIDWSVTANALYKGFAGYMVTIKQTGATTAFTDEATTLVAGKTYKITNAAKNVWDREVAVVVEDDGVVVDAANILNIDYLFGEVTFISTYTVVGAVTVSGSYLPMASLAKYRSFTLTQSMEAVDNSDVPTLQGNSGHMTYDFGLRTVSLEVAGVYGVANGYRTQLINRAEVIIEINPDGAGKTVARGFFRPAARGQQGNVGALEEETMNWNLSVPVVENMKAPFSWKFTNTDVSMAVQKCLDAFQNNTNLYVKYLPYGGTVGLKGQTLVTDFSLTGGTEAMNEFSVTLQGTGQVTALT